MLVHFEIQNNPPVSKNLFTPAGAYQGAGARSLPAVRTEPGSPGSTFQADSPHGADLLGPGNERLQGAGFT
jgi:hypothetical protein